MKPAAWLIRDCPDFYFMPSMKYDQVFYVFDTGQKNSPAYWQSRGWPVVELFECDDGEATHWLVNGKYAVFDRESAEAARFLKKAVVPVKEAP